LEIWENFEEKLKIADTKTEIGGLYVDIDEKESASKYLTEALDIYIKIDVKPKILLLDKRIQEVELNCHINE
jgi:predicted RNA-binding protein associated with RNAse of E/G family